MMRILPYPSHIASSNEDLQRLVMRLGFNPFCSTFWTNTKRNEQVSRPNKLSILQPQSKANWWPNNALIDMLWSSIL